MNIWLVEIWRSWRASLRRPGFLLLASGVLALGIGASVAVLALIQNTLLKPSSLPQVERVVVLGQVMHGHVQVISKAGYQHLGKPDGIESMGLLGGGTVANIAGAGEPEQVTVAYFDRGLLPTLGLNPALGRNFSAQEDRPNGPKVVMLSHGLWLRRYGGDPQVVGRGMQVDGVTHMIVGVLPANFGEVMDEGAIALPMALPANSDDGGTNYVAIARLATGADLERVSAQVDARLRAMYRDLGYPHWERARAGAEGLLAWQHQEARPLLMLFLASALLVLLIALVNLVNLMLLRMLSRGHDAAVRAALGAPSIRLMLPALGEGALIGLCGASLGMGLAILGLALLQGAIPAEWLSAGRVRLGGLAWALASAVGLAGALLAAVLGLWRSRTAATVDELRAGGRSGLGVRSGRLGRVLVVAQVALAAILLSAAGVIAHALYDASQRPLGFDTGNILTFEVAPVQTLYPDGTSVQDLSQHLLDRLRAIPGVTGVTVTTNLPSGGQTDQFNMGDVHLPGGPEFYTQYHGVAPGFFELFGIRLRKGRGFERGDRRGTEPVAIVSQNLADAQFGGDALGKTIQQGEGAHMWSARIVGVAADTYQRGPLRPTEPMLYLPLAQMPEETLALFRSFEPLRFALRGHGDPMQWRDAVRQAMAEIAPGQPFANLRTMQAIVHQTTAQARLNLLLVGLFSALALVLAAAGLYAVMAVAVAAREREFGVRLALGAPPARLMRQVLRGGLTQIAIGLLIGTSIAMALTRALSSLLMPLLHRASGFDPVALLGVCLVLAAAGLLACLLPAIRAARVHPMYALRGQ